MVTDVNPSGESATRRYWVRPAFLLLVVGGLFAASRFLPVVDWLRETLLWVDDLGAWGPVALGVLYVVATVFFVPGLILTLGAGALFGLVTGTITVSIASTLGASAAFLVGKYFARDSVARWIRSYPKFEAIDRAVAREGWKIVGLTRLSPVFPFNLLNYAYGITRVSFRDYVLASWIGMIPGTILYVYLGTAIGNIAEFTIGEQTRSRGETVFFAAGLVIALIVTIFITRIARKALQEAINSANGTENT